MLFKGGAAFISNIDPVTTLLQAFIEGERPGYIAMIEFTVKDVLALFASTTPKVIYYTLEW